jgi:hypothetical protein
MLRTAGSNSGSPSRMSRAGTLCPKQNQNCTTSHPMKKQPQVVSLPINGSAQLSRLDRLVPVTGRPGACVNAVFLYEDATTREWAREAHDRIVKLAGKETIRPTWWRLDNLSAPGILAAAASTAMRADVIVIAVSATDSLPLPFYTWISSWLPNRLRGTGVLAAVVGKTKKASARSARLAKYLREVARAARLEFLTETRKLVSAPKRVMAADDSLFYSQHERVAPLRAA